MIAKEFSSEGRALQANIPQNASLLNNREMASTASLESKEVPDILPSPSQKNNQHLVKERPCNRHRAAVRLQKTYKSFRTRRQLADCAVIVEQRWWKLLDFAELKRSSVSFFDIEKHETAVSRWSRAGTRAAKVGKGLSQDDKARKLAFQHWLEAIDPRHRYGHNLRLYYAKWLQCESRQPFFYWLDIGEGKEVSLEKCPRSKLHQQCIKYLGPMERQEFEVEIDNGKFMYKQSGKLLETRGGPEGTKWIFVLSASKILYIGQKKKGTFQHSSFLAGGATLSAGRLEIEDGILKAVWPHSGHYLPTEENFEEFMSFLEQHNVDISVIQKAPNSEDEEAAIKKEDGSRGVPEPEPAFSCINEESNSRDKTDPCRNNDKNTENSCSTSARRSRRLRSKIASIQIPSRENILGSFDNEKQKPSPSNSVQSAETPADGYETAEEYLSDTEVSVSKLNLFDDDEEEEYEEPIPKEKILSRIFSHNGMKSYQLARHLSCKWTTGAGPRIGCVRDYPPELQFRALEEVSLSPRPLPPHKYARPSSRLPTPSNLCRETSADRSQFASEPAMLPKMLAPRY